MSPTNEALVKLFQADRTLRAAQERLDHESRSVRIQERRIADLQEKLRLAAVELREQQARQAQLELDVKSRDAHIEKLREQQQHATNHKEYQAFLTEINTEKIDKNKSEDEAIKVMEVVERRQKEIADLSAQIAAEQAKNAETRAHLQGRLSELQAEIDRLIPLRDEAAKAVPPRALDMFERLCERFEGEAMASIGKPDRRTEEYLCNACNMSLVADIYNRLHSREDPVVCPNCRRLLYIPEELTPELAINKPRERREPRPRQPKVASAVGRQTSAIDVMRSITPEEEPAAEADEATDATSDAAQPAPPQDPPTQA